MSPPFHTKSHELWQFFFQHAQSSPGAVGGLVLILLATIWLCFREFLSNRLAPTQSQQGKHKVLHGANQVRNRPPGVWNPVDFTYPAIEPLPSELSDTEPVPYRPFRWGQYHITMGIRSMPWNEWIELDNQYETYHRIRSARIATRGKNVVRVQPEKPGLVQSGAAAAIELLHEVAEYLPQRYPTTFRVTRCPIPSSSDEFEIASITIVPLGETYDLPSRDVDQEDLEAAEKALKIVSLLVQDDLAIMIEGQDGRYYFQAGAILIAGSWRMQDKIGLPLAEIHTSGGVPRYQEKLQMSMDRFFQRLAVDKPVVRNNYTFQAVPSKDLDAIDPEELAWAETVHGPEDDYPNHHKDPDHPPKIEIANVRLRTERQTLRRLPKSGAIVFGIRTYMTPVEKIGKEPEVAGRLASSMRAWGEDVGAYKGKKTGGWYDLVLDYLDQCHGGVQDGEQTTQREDRYPF